MARLGRVHPVNGNPDVVLCERGIRTFETRRGHGGPRHHPLVKKLTHLPVIFDPSHATGSVTSCFPRADRCRSAHAP